MPLTLADLPEIMSVEQASQYLNVSKNTAYSWCRTGEMPNFKVGNTRRIRKEKLVQWIADLEARRGETLQ